MTEHEDETLRWDKAALQTRVRGKQDRMVKLIKLFLEDMPARIEDLASQVNQAHLEEIQQIAHTIKGVSANLGVMRLQSAAIGLEDAARNAEADKTRTLLPAMLIEYEKSEQVLQEFVSSNS